MVTWHVCCDVTRLVTWCVLWHDVVVTWHVLWHVLWRVLCYDTACVVTWHVLRHCVCGDTCCNVACVVTRRVLWLVTRVVTWHVLWHGVCCDLWHVLWRGVPVRHLVGQLIADGLRQCLDVLSMPAHRDVRVASEDVRMTLPLGPAQTAYFNGGENILPSGKCRTSKF